MALRYLLDENIRGALWFALIRHNASSDQPIDVERVGDPIDLPLGTEDPDILIWAEREGYALVTFDIDTMPGFFWNHLRAGNHLAGVFIIRPRSRPRDLIDWLVEAADTGDDEQWRDQLLFIP